MVVAYNALSVRPGVFDGGATFSLNVLHHLAAALPEARLVVYVREGEDRVPRLPSIRLRPLRVRGPLARVALELGRLGASLRRERVDVFLSPNESLPARVPCRLVVVAQNLGYHCGEAAPGAGSALDRAAACAQSRYYRRRMPGAYARADRVVALSRTAAELLAERASLDLGRTTIVPGGSDSIFLGRPDPSLPREPRLLVVSALARYKNLEETVDVVARLQRRRPELGLDLAGGDRRGYARVVERRAERCRPGSVRVLGAVGPERLTALYRRSTLLLHLSGCEAFGLPVVEAMRFGLPVVAAARSSLPEVTGGAALLVDPADVDGAATAVGELLGDDDRRDRLADQGRRRAAELTWRRTAEGIAAAVLAAAGSG